VNLFPGRSQFVTGQEQGRNRGGIAVIAVIARDRRDRKTMPLMTLMFLVLVFCSCLGGNRRDRFIAVIAVIGKP
jgi:hypothetical protein